ncbi:CRISPR-associated helicase/endonuclease Cas3 [Corallococcus macrosporus]|uniref:CRISPR-associated helicase/endonuclease Cas3 n=1 Tax=Corallococcus macrosporus DSM 14697 TaxID=1189310 RepID=A0A286NVX6_9BACT|nr:CRISPR-associated helicase/endonuclease Cas3 [Corallococcus macrosporus]ATB51321.1 CRISPR-associated helicase/endonuclease Cas3 [Corallococcus macrosporus DSM 14697]
MKRLLAKSTATPDRPEGEATLLGHTALVLSAARRLLEHRGRASLLAAGLDPALEPRLRRIVLLAAALHDLGKCSEHFQSMLRRKRDAPQWVRHEALSLWLCWPGQPLSAWLLRDVSELDLGLALVCVAAHHRKFQADAFAPEDAGAGLTVELLVQHEDFTRTLARIAEELSLSAPPVFTAPLLLRATRTAHPRDQLQAWQEDFERTIPASAMDARLLAVCKALVLAADVAGSALPRSGERQDWVDRQLTAPHPGEALLAVVERRLAGRMPRPFQEAVARCAAPLTLVRAGCGSGKTAAAYLWAARQHPGRPLWLTYPTMGTATEGFRDYLHGADVDARLQHSRAEVDFDIFGLRDGAARELGSREQDRLDALRSWGVDAMSCTADTVLGLVQSQRQGLYAWPALCAACVVFDEVHAYDDRLFGCLLRFLEALPGIPALLMTASLPAARLGALREVCERVHGQRLAEVDGPEDLEALPRYQRLDVAEPWALVARCLEGNGKVLWVSNTVERCMRTAEVATSHGAHALLYHSRFRYADRVHRHGDVIETFATPDRAVFASTTQVAEMSLDLSADLLVTDLAPIAALIQRLGRLNRRSTPERPGPVRPFVVLPFDGPPYGAPDLREARAWLERLGTDPLSQQDLVDAWSPSTVASPRRASSTWLDGRFDTWPAPCRDGSPSLTVLLEKDAEDVRTGAVSAHKVTLPMNLPPDSFRWRAWPRAGRLPYPIPPAHLLEYDELRGARWRKP